MESVLEKRALPQNEAWQRWCVVTLMIIALSGGYMLLYALSPLQTLLDERYGWSLTAYSRYSSAESFLNVFCCVLLMTGLLIDRLGERISGILSGVLMLAGGVMNYYALTDSFVASGLADWLDGTLNLPADWWNITPFCIGMVPSAKLGAIGFMLFGVGIEMAGVAASRCTVRWFKGKELAVAMGIQLAGSRIMVSIALWASPRIAQYGNEISAARPVGWTVLILVVGLICWLGYGMADKSRNLSATRNNRQHVWTPLASLCVNNRTNRLLWLLASICVLYYASLIPFYRYATAMFQVSIGVESTTAATVLASLPLVSALATPLVCLIPDFRGGATWLMTSGCICLIISYMAFALLLPVYHSLWIAVCGIVLLGVASALVSAGLWPLLPRIAPEESLGSAYAAFYWLQAIGLYLTPLTVAFVMDNENEYPNAMFLFASIAMAALVGVARLAYLNKQLNLGLNEPNRLKASNT